MTLEEYKTSIRKYRGHLRSMDKDLEIIYDYGVSEFVDYSLTSKKMGVSKMAIIADNMNDVEQVDLITWLGVKGRSKTDIDIYLLGVL